MTLNTSTLLALAYVLGLACAAPAANAAQYNFSQTGFDGGGIIHGSFEATDTNGDGFITTPEVSAFSLAFTGDSSVADFSQGLPQLYILNYHAGSAFLGDEVIGAFQEVIGTNWFASTGFSYASGMGAGGFGGNVTNLDSGDVSSSEKLVAIPVPGTLWLFGIGLVGLVLQRRASAV
jgi:hypothetical protein